LGVLLSVKPSASDSLWFTASEETTIALDT
jgi:hypothetical protein